MSGFRPIKREFSEAPWVTETERQDFVRRASAHGVDLPKLIALLLPDPELDRHHRKARIRAFVDVCNAAGTGNLFGPMLKACVKGDDMLRMALRPLLARFHQKNQHGAVVKLLKSEQAALRELAASLLEEVGGRTALRLLESALSETGWSSRIEAMRVSMVLGGHHAIGSVAGVLRHGSPEERIGAVRLLGDLHFVRSGRRAASEALEPALQADIAGLRVEGVKAFGAVAPSDVFFDRLVPLVRDRDRRVQQEVVRAMAGHPGERSMVELKDVFVEADSDLRKLVLEVLGKVGSDAALPILVEGLSDPSLPIRNAALDSVVTLSKSKQIDVGRMLFWLLRSPNVQVRRQAVEIVEQAGQALRELWPALLQLLRDEDWWVRERVVDAMVEVGGTELTRHIVAYLQDPKDVVRRYAVEVLMRIKDPRSLGALVKLAAADDDWWVRERAIECMGEIGDTRVLPHLVQLAEKDAALVPAVVSAVGRLRDAKGLTFLARVLRYDDVDLQIMALEAADRIADTRFSRFVEPLLGAPEQRVRDAARKLLGRWQTRFDTSDDSRAIADRLEGLERMLWWMVKRGGDDLFISAGRPPFMKHMGEMKALSERALTADEVEGMLSSLLTGHHLERFEQLEDVDLSMSVDSLGVRFRANIHRQLGSWGAVLRRIGNDLFELADLGLPPLVQELCEAPHGLVLVGGPTGSGKSTTLAAMIHSINRNHGRHIITIEDPIEVVHENVKSLVTQREVGSHTKSFAHALRSTLREDPDVILVGEMRDLQTIQFALTAAETGHLVLATVHTVSADTSIDRLIDAFPPAQQPQVRAQLSQTLRAVVCQQLLRKRSGEGRVVAAELLLNTDAVANVIRKGRCFQLPSIIATSREQGMQSMDSELLRLVKERQVEPKEAYVKSIEKKLFEPFLEAATAEEAAIAAAKAEVTELAERRKQRRDVRQSTQVKRVASGGAGGPQEAPPPRPAPSRLTTTAPSAEPVRRVRRVPIEHAEDDRSNATGPRMVRRPPQPSVVRSNTTPSSPRPTGSAVRTGSRPVVRTAGTTTGVGPTRVVSVRSVKPARRPSPPPATNSARAPAKATATMPAATDADAPPWDQPPWSEEGG